MGEGLKRAFAAANATRWPVWAIEWRGKITRDIGVEYEQRPTMTDARNTFMDRYPMREVIAISRCVSET